jgi:ABC-type molybdate transport system substrate-binding protein
MVVNFGRFSIIKGTEGFWKKCSARAGGLSNCIQSVFRVSRYRKLGWLMGSGVVLASLYAPLIAAEPNVAAASSLIQVLQEISRHYRNHNGQPVKLIFGSSRGLAHQIRAGAPYDIFLSADAESIRLL